MPPLEFGFYIVKNFKMDKILFSLLFGAPLGKNRSQGPVHTCNFDPFRIFGTMLNFFLISILRFFYSKLQDDVLRSKSSIEYILFFFQVQYLFEFNGSYDVQSI